MRNRLLVFLTCSMLTFAMPVGAAIEVGASGQCYDGPGEGGEGHFAVGDDGVSHSGVDNQSVLFGVLAFFNDQLTQDPEPYCEADDPGEPDEYVEVHAEAAGFFVQGCYAGQDDETGIHTEPACRTRPGALP